MPASRPSYKYDVLILVRQSAKKILANGLKRKDNLGTAYSHEIQSFEHNLNIL
jgi:hypothetical protein